MPTIKETFEYLNKVREKQKELHDEEGFSEYFKLATDKLFEIFTNPTDKDIPMFHFEDIDYGDGYFIFSFGTNSVIQFRIAECPGWLFGIWWDGKNIDGKIIIEGQLFAQYEETIDKFKPSRSEYTENIVYDIESKELDWFSIYKAKDIFTFIRDYPTLAFYRDYTGTDFNYKYVSLDKANRRFNKYKKHKAESIIAQKEFETEVLNLYRTELNDLKNFEIVYQGEGWSPRYDIVVPLNDNKNFFEENGSYHLSELFDKKRYKELQKNLKQLEKKYKKFYFSTCSIIHDFVEVLDEEQWLECKKSEEVIK